MTAQHGHTTSGTPPTNELLDELADDAETGYDILRRRGKRDRPALGSSRSTAESVRLNPDLKAKLAKRAEEEGVSASEVIREALRRYLDAAS